MPLNCHTNYSFRFGAMGVRDLLAEAGAKGLRKVALTDVNNTSAILDFFRLAPQYGVEPVAGIDFRNGAQQRFIGIAANNEGFYELNKFLTRCLKTGEAIISREAPEFDNAIIIYPFANVPARDLRANEFVGVREHEISKVMFSDWKNKSAKLLALCPGTFRGKRDFNAHRLLRAMDNNTLLSKLPIGEISFPTDLVLSKEEMLQRFQLLPQLAQNTFAVLGECKMNFEFHSNKNKQTFTGDTASDWELMQNLSADGLEYRYGKNPGGNIRQRLQKELDSIRELGFSSYFLINWDIVRYARNKNYFYVGRGSGANSLVAYCLRITDVDPIELDLYFERFINPHRVNPPDFDIDFSWKDRDDVVDYIFKQHGKEHTALLATYTTFQSNAVMRELGKVFGFPKGEIDDMIENPRPAADNKAMQAIYFYSKYLHDFPNHLNIHAGGILISEKPVHYYTATSTPPKGLPLTQFSMLEAEDLGLYKFDILSQRGLGHIRDSVAIVEKNRGVKIDIHDIKKFKKDPKIADLIRTAKCMGCFYVESPGMRMLLKKLEADDYLTLVAASSIIRPGVASSGMMREYIVRFHDKERKFEANCPKEMLDLMRETYGVMVYQEDVIKVAHYFAGLSLGEADMLRRGMSGKFRSREEFAKVKEKFKAACLAKGHTDAVTNEVWRQIESFAGYSFSKGHSASYAVESYQSLYLKAHFPFDFMVGVINNFGGFYSTEHYVHEAKMCGANVHAPCINKSRDVTVIYGDDIYLGFALMGELEKNSIELILKEQEAGAFKDLPDFMRRVKITPDQLRILIRVDAFRFTGKTKKQLMWEIFTSPELEKKKINNSPELFKVEATEFTLPALHHGKYDDAMDEIEILGFPLQSPFSLLKDRELYTLRVADLPNLVGQTIEIAGYMVAIKYATTKRGDAMMFGAFTDGDGYFFDTVHFPKIAAAYPFRGKAVYLIKGKVSEEFGFYTVDVSEMQRLMYDFANG
jgi:error-prone DNA polymerase